MKHDRNVCKDGPKNLTQKQTDNRKNICSDIKERITEETDLLTNVIICDEWCTFQQYVETKSQSILWKASYISKNGKALRSSQN